MRIRFERLDSRNRCMRSDEVYGPDIYDDESRGWSLEPARLQGVTYLGTHQKFDRSHSKKPKIV